MVRQLSICVLLCLLMAGATGAGPAYKVVILHPSGFWDSAAHGISGGQQVGEGLSSAPASSSHALLWSGTAGSYVDLNPSGCYYSCAYGVSDGQQVGEGWSSPPGSPRHALLWSGTAGSYVDLNPSGCYYSCAYGISGGQQVGEGWSRAWGSYDHPLLWSGTANSMVDLHPAGFDDSYAYGVSDGQQVGWGWSSGPVSSMHALLWSGTAESYVDLNPSGFESSCAYGVSGGQQVGEGWSSAPGSSSHALLWSGTAGSCVDLNPSGFYSSHAHGISGGQQVGAGDFSATDYHGHALLWSGTPESYVDLHSFLPAGYVSSEAYGIDSSGKIVGWARMADGYTKHAVMWVREFMITFDDGPGSVSTPYILDQLKNIKKADGNSVKAGFFLVGENKSRATCYDIWKCDFWRCVPWWPDDRCPDPGVISNLGIVQRIANEGHFIGIHTQHHPDLENLTPEDVNSEIIDCYNAIQVAGVAPMKVFRSPYLHDPENIPPSLQDWKKIRGNLTGDPSPFISEQSVINNCKEIMEQATKFPVTLIFHDFRGLPSHRFNFENIVNELKKDYELVDFDPDIASQEVNAIATNTPSGDNVLVILPTNNYVQFSNVTDAGETDTTIVEDSPPLPSNYVLLGAYYDVITTAAYNGPVTVTFAYDVDSQKWVRLLHYEDGQWVDITNPDQPDIFNGIISGTVDNLSLFAVVYLSADLNRDGKVDFADFSLFANNWLEADCEESNNWCEGTDFDHIGSVDMLDLAAFARYWIEGI